jgi:hypothetical protein
MSPQKDRGIVVLTGKLAEPGSLEYETTLKRCEASRHPTLVTTLHTTLSTTGSELHSHRLRYRLFCRLP